MASIRKNPTKKAAVKNAAAEAVKEAAAVSEPAVKPVEAPKPVETKAEDIAKTAKKPGRTPGRKSAAKPAEAPKPVETKAEETAKAAKKPGRTAAKKSAAKKAEAPEVAAPKKRAPRKPKVITTDDVVAKVAKRIDKTVAAQILPEGKAAVDIKLYGAFEAHMYIEIKDGSVTVAPYDYIEKDLEAAIPVDVALAVADGKTTVKQAVENGSLYVFGNVQYALMFAKLFK